MNKKAYGFEMEGCLTKSEIEKVSAEKNRRSQLWRQFVRVMLPVMSRLNSHTRHPLPPSHIYWAKGIRKEEQESEQVKPNETLSLKFLYVSQELGPLHSISCQFCRLLAKC